MRPPAAGAGGGRRPPPLMIVEDFVTGQVGCVAVIRVRSERWRYAEGMWFGDARLIDRVCGLAPVRASRR